MPSLLEYFEVINVFYLRVSLEPERKEYVAGCVDGVSLCITVVSFIYYCLFCWYHNGGMLVTRNREWETHPENLRHWWEGRASRELISLLFVPTSPTAQLWWRGFKDPWIPVYVSFKFVLSSPFPLLLRFFSSIPSLDSTKWTAFTSHNACIQCFVLFFWKHQLLLCSFFLNILFLFYFYSFFLFSFSPRCIQTTYPTHDSDFLVLVSFIGFKG